MSLHGLCEKMWRGEEYDITWGVDDGQVGAVLVFNLDHDLLGPELLLPLQPLILILNVLLQGTFSGICWVHTER